MFLRGCEAAGLANTELFITNDLYDANDIPLVCTSVPVISVLFPCLGLSALGSRYAEHPESSTEQGPSSRRFACGDAGAGESCRRKGTSDQAGVRHICAGARPSH
jgi:hypothetical protein